MAVAAGDTVAVEAYGRYDVKRGGRLASALVPVVALTPDRSSIGTQNESAAIPGRVLSSIPLGISAAWFGVTQVFGFKREKVPSARLVWELYTKDSSLVNSSFIALSNEASLNWQRLAGGVRAKENSYIQVYLENASPQDAWFDDVALRLTVVAQVGC